MCQWLCLCGVGRVGVAGLRARPAHARRVTMACKSVVGWNRQNPPGTLVRVPLRDGSALEARTRSYATQWVALAVVALDGHSGLFTAAALQPVRS